MKLRSCNPWPLAIIAFFATAIVCIGIFIGFAVRQREDLVANNYYEKEMQFQEHLDALNRSQSFASQVLATFDPQKQEIVISLPAKATHGATGRIHLYRPSDARLDREIPLSLNANGVQPIDARELREGLWKVRAEWSMDGHEFTLEQPVVVTVQ